MNYSEQDPTDIRGILDLMSEAIQGEERVSMEDMLEITGQRSFGPLILIAGLIVAMPVVGDFPGATSMLNVLVLLSLLQLLLHRNYIWIPKWMRTRSLSTDKLRKGIQWLQRPAGFIDRFARPRLPMFIEGFGTWAILVTCIALTPAILIFEFIPFTAWSIGVIWSAFGLALISKDGLLALLGILGAAIIMGVVLFPMLL